MAVWFGKVRRGMAGVLACSMCVTALILVIHGRGWEVLPMHLCSLSALCALALALHPRGWMLDFLWYLGMPGAALALLFPAPAAGSLQFLINLSYAATHLLILLIPALMMLLGMRPQAARSGCALLILQGIALAAHGMNSVLDTNFLFLSAPPAGTPLEWFFQMGMPVYLMVLEALMAGAAAGMERLRIHMFERGGK